jgi:hypothetical protein
MARQPAIDLLPHPLDLNKLVGLDEPEFSASLLFQAFCRNKQFESSFLATLLRQGGFRGEELDSFTVVRNDIRAQWVHGPRRPPLQAFVERGNYTVAIGIHCICADPLLALHNRAPWRTDEFPLYALIAPQWRSEALREALEPEYNVVVITYHELDSIVDETGRGHTEVSAPALLSRYLSRREYLIGVSDLPDWLFLTLDYFGTPEHWSVMEGLRACFLDADPELSRSEHYLGFSFEYGDDRGWLWFNERPGFYPSGRNVALVLSLPHPEEINHPAAVYLHPDQPDPESEDAPCEFAHWEIQYGLDWTTLENWFWLFGKLTFHSKG